MAGNQVLKVVLAGVMAVGLAQLSAAGGGVEVVVKEAERRVDVTIDGQPFTSYIWPESQKKPVLYPLRTARGTVVTRGYPLDPQPGERVDHPHHLGLWFNYGDVNGLDFWNNSDAVAPARQASMGTVVHRKVALAKGGPTEGVLEVDGDWVGPDGAVLLKERTRYVFRGTASTRSVDRITTLTAGATRVALKDNKEGVLGLRVARALEEPLTKPERLVGPDGKPAAAPALDNTGVNGEYLTSEGKRGGAVWGTRGKWCALSGKVAGEMVTIAILDHPSNPGYPTYWHARGYGLFAANPLGQHELSGGKEALNYAIEPNQSTTFRHRILISSGGATADQTEAAWKAFSAKGS